ncbi:hypothetical protein WA158_000959 [Blastocystis sp. Blastoise]
MKSCIFCDINDRKSPQSKTIIYEDEFVYVMPDKYPHALGHFLVIPKVHIIDVHVLGVNDIDLLKHMMKVGEQIMESQGEQYKGIKYGFHVRPFHSIKHLHLHCLGLPYHSCFDNIIYHSPFFMTADKALIHLEKKTKKMSV